jgi:flagellin-like protein
MKKISMFDIPDKDDRGVSPVIGVILMVAITVILAAVIASFVLGFGSSISSNVQAGATISTNDDGTASVTWIDKGNAQNLNVSIQGLNDNVQLNDVGESVTIIYNASKGSNTFSDNTITLYNVSSPKVIVTGIGSGGSKTVITSETVELENQGG